MQAPTLQRAVDLQETVKAVLAQKGHATWSISPDASVFDAIATMSEKHVGALVVLSGGRSAFRPRPNS